MKKLFLLTILLSMTFIVKGQTLLSLDSCRALALANNKDLLISNEKINAAHYERKAAFTNYLPNFSATGTYMRNQKEFSLLNKDQKAALSGLGTNLAGPIQQAATQIATAHPELAPLISSLSGELGAVLPALDQVGNSLVDALRTDTRNVYAGAITLTQPLYMGGKIRAYNKITKYAEELAQQQHQGGMQEVIMSTDQAYWQVISLVNKKKLAEGYLKLLQQQLGRASRTYRQILQAERAQGAESRSRRQVRRHSARRPPRRDTLQQQGQDARDRKSTRLNSSH